MMPESMGIVGRSLFSFIHFSGLMPERRLALSRNMDYEQDVLAIANDIIGGLSKDSSWDDIERLLQESLGDADFTPIGCSYDEQLDFIAKYGDKAGVEFSGTFRLEDIWSVISDTAAETVRGLCNNELTEAFEALRKFMKEECLDFSQKVSENAHGWARHWGEDEKDSCTVYQYRNLEGEKIHIDVYEYLLYQTSEYWSDRESCRKQDKVKIWFEKHLEPDEVSEEENNFDAA